jgi:rfaE bifunctional protein kinase chain/domain
MNTIKINEALSRKRLIDILDAIQSVRVGVVGDFTLDAYWYADMTRSQLSRETPLFPRPVNKETYSPGGAANVAWNLADLQPKQTFAFTAFGPDWRGQILTDLLQKVGVEPSTSLTVDSWSTPLFGKVLLTNGNLMQEDSRLDFINSMALPENEQEDLFSKIQEQIPNLDALIIADYQGYGIFGDRLRRRLIEAASKNPSVIFVVDSRHQVGIYPGMILKPNEVEAGSFLFPGRDVRTISELEWLEAGQRLTRHAGKPIFLTRGEQGCWLFTEDNVTHIQAVKVPPPIDTVGAGDTFVAALTASLAASAGSASGANELEAGMVATLASAVTIKFLRMTGTASPAAIVNEYDLLVGH